MSKSKAYDYSSILSKTCFDFFRTPWLASPNTSNAVSLVSLQHLKTQAARTDNLIVKAPESKSKNETELNSS